MVESEEELKRLLMRVKEESQKPELKLNSKNNQDHGLWSHHFMANRWGKEEAVASFIFLGSKVTVNSDGSHEIKRRLLLGRKAMTNVDNVLKNRNISFLKKVHIVKAMVFPVVIYGCESFFQ